MGGQFRRTSVTGKQIKEEILRKSVLERVICVSTFYLIMELTKGMSIPPCISSSIRMGLVSHSKYGVWKNKWMILQIHLLKMKISKVLDVDGKWIIVEKKVRKYLERR